MREAVVVASSRTPLAKSFRGSFNLTRPDELAAHCITDVLRKVPGSTRQRSRTSFSDAQCRKDSRETTSPALHRSGPGCRLASPA